MTNAENDCAPFSEADPRIVSQTQLLRVSAMRHQFTELLKEKWRLWTFCHHILVELWQSFTKLSVLWTPLKGFSRNKSNACKLFTAQKCGLFLQWHHTLRITAKTRQNHGWVTWKHTFCMLPFNMKFKNRQDKSIGTEVRINGYLGGWGWYYRQGVGSGLTDPVLYLGGDDPGVHIWDIHRRLQYFPGHWLFLNNF